MTTATDSRAPAESRSDSGSGFARRLDALAGKARARLARVELARCFGTLALWSVAGMALALAGLPVRPELATIAALVFYAGAALLFWRGVRRYRPVDGALGRRAVDALMEGEPASARHDTPVPDTERGRQFLAIHAERLAIEARSLRTPDTAKLWKRVDPFRLRWIAPIWSAIAIFAAQDAGLERVLSAARIDIGTFVGAHRMTMQAWVTPPVHTGLAPFHIEDGQRLDAPEGSAVTVRLHGSRRPQLRLVAADGERTTLRADAGADGVFAFETRIDGSARVDVLLFGVRKTFALTAIPDTPPMAGFTSIPEAGENDTLQFGWSAQDDYGVTAAFLDIRLADPDHGHSDEVVTEALSMSRIEPESISDDAALDLTRHKWAGLKVQANVRVSDAIGQFGHSAAAFFTMPEKLFLDPLALASVDVRAQIMREHAAYAEQQDSGAIPDDAPHPVYATERVSALAAAPESIVRATRILDALTWSPDGVFDDLAVFLGLRHARELLGAAESMQQTGQAQDVLWQVALRAELGSLADALRALNLARQELENALRDGADDNEVNRRIDALRQAIDRYTQLAIERALEQGNFADGQGGDSDFDIDSFEDMLRALEDLAGTGARDQARQLLADMYSLLRSMQNLQLRSGGGGRGIPGQDTPEASETDKEVEELADLLRDQRQLNDDTYRLGQDEQSGQGSQQQDQSQTPDQQQDGQQDSPGGDQNQSLAERQEEIRRRLGRMRNEGDASIRQFLDEALSEQRRAGEALSEGRPDRARRPQSRASNALRDAITELAEKADSERGDTDSAGDLDPLERPSRGGGQSDRVMIPDAVDRKRARDILDELLRRSMDPAVDDRESDYLERLLKRY